MVNTYGVKAGFSFIGTFAEYWPAMEAAELERAALWEALPEGHKGSVASVVVVELDRISAEAVKEKRDNWVEINGWAHGSAVVDHPDWWALLEKLCKREGLTVPQVPAHKPFEYLVWDENGDRIATSGLMHIDQGGRLVVEG